MTIVVIWSSGAAAQGLDKDADAERLFREGQQLMADHRYGEACPKFEAAYRKDQQLGTLLNLAYCHKEQGATWQAWVEFKEAETKAIELRRNDRRDFARQRMAELEKSLAKAVIEPTSKVDLTEVLVEDRRVPEAEHGHVFAIEPGQRKLSFRAKGKKAAVQLVTIVKGGSPQRIAVPEMEDQPKEPPPPPEPAPEAAKPPPPATIVVVKRERDLESSPLRTVGLVAAGVGLVGLGVGAVTGIMTLTSDCSPRPEDVRCDPSELDRAGTTATISTASFIAGGVLVAGGGLLYLLFAPAKGGAAAEGTTTTGQQHTPALTPELGAGWAGLHGTF